MTDFIGTYIYSTMAGTFLFDGLQMRKLKILGYNAIARGHKMS